MSDVSPFSLITALVFVFPGEPSAVCISDASAAQRQSASADLAAGPGGDGLQEGPQGSFPASCGPPPLYRLPGPAAEECRGVPTPEARRPA